MFDLEKSIADWRTQMLAAGIKTPAPLEELEIHLREQVEWQINLGADPQKALDMAISQLGRPDVLKQEFKKLERNHMKRTLAILLGIFGVLVGTAIIMPALAKHNQLGIWNSSIVWPMVVGTIITLLGAGLAVRNFKRRKA